MKIKLNRIDVAEAAYLAESTSNALRVDFTVLSDADLILRRDKKYGIVDTLNIGEDSHEFLYIVGLFEAECMKRSINPGYAPPLDPNGEAWTRESYKAYKARFRPEVFNEVTLQWEVK